SNAGADVAWGLWVTKFAPPGRVADYMSVHTFFTGVRGVVAPLVAFSSVASLSPHTLGWISVGLITTGSAFLISEIAIAPGSKPGQPPAVETSPDRE
ncbi:MAG: MFS transporter, partial [Verrucomicrobia bacterium]|nr:MFS transporter [Verrucomicrobiota bacterium]